MSETPKIVSNILISDILISDILVFGHFALAPHFHRPHWNRHEAIISPQKQSTLATPPEKKIIIHKLMMH
jgi:hypothetical protein